MAGSASPFSFAGTALKATSTTASMAMTTGMGVNGFWRIGRLVSRVMMEDDDVKFNAINAGPATTDYMAYQYKYDIIRCCNLNKVGRVALGADYVCKSTGISLTKETA